MGLPNASASSHDQASLSNVPPRRLPGRQLSQETGVITLPLPGLAFANENPMRYKVWIRKNASFHMVGGLRPLGLASGSGKKR